MTNTDSSPSSRFIGLIGLGYWGKNILRNFYELGVLNTACDSNLYTLSERKELFPDVIYTPLFEDILQNQDIKAVAIATPAITHYDYVKQALLAGKDVFVEKPLALTVKEGREIVEIAENEKRVLMVGHILQYHPAIVKLKELITSAELGRIEYIYSNRLNIGKLRTEENILWSFAPHDISVIVKLLEEEPTMVTAFGGDYLSRGIYDTTLTTLDFKNGVKGHIFVSWLHPYKEQKLIVIGSKAMAVFDDVSDEKLFFYPHKIEWKNGKVPIAQKSDFRVIPLQNGEPLKIELSHFVECVQQRKQPCTDGKEGLSVLKVLESAEQSLFSHSLSFPQNEPSISCRTGTNNFYIHKSSCIDDNVEIGEKTKIWHFCHVLKGTQIGEKCIIGQNVVLGPDVKIGNRCKIQNNVSVYKGVILEDDVFCGPSCVFTNVYNPRAFIERKHVFKKTLVKKGATIGANATIVCGATIGKYAMIGAGAVVKSDIPDYAVVAGVPARQIGWACRCGFTLTILNNHATCTECGNEYKTEGTNIVVLKEG